MLQQTYLEYISYKVQYPLVATKAARPTPFFVFDHEYYK